MRSSTMALGMVVFLGLGMVGGSFAAEAKAPSLPPPTRTEKWPNLCQFASGVPLGGIGAGCVEIRADGSFRQWEIFNNWGGQLTTAFCSYPPSYDLLNAFAALGVDDKAFVLETKPVTGGLPGVKAVDYDGKFPFANLKYLLPKDVPVTVSLEAFGSYIPHRPDDSGQPALGLSYTVTNTGEKPAEVRLALSVVNPLGDLCSVEHKEKLNIAVSGDGRSGLAVASLDAVAIHVLGGQDDQENLTTFWTAFAGSAPLKEQITTGKRIVEVVPFSLKPGETRKLRFVIGWFFPDHRENGVGSLVGHYYENLVDSPAAAVTRFAGGFEEFRKASATWRDTMLDASWPKWATDWLVNMQGNIVKSSWWVKDGRWIMYESMDCPNSGPIHVIHLADWPILDAFPKLELDLLRRFAKDQYANGRLSEEYNGKRGGPSITFLGGRDLMDLSPKYALEIWHRYKETGDQQFLQDTYPAVKKAMAYAQGFDSDDDGLPDHTFNRSTWDLMNTGYLSSYAAPVWLTGLRATEQLARIMKENAYAAEMAKLLAKGRASLDAKLWNGSYYAYWSDKDGKKSDVCFMDQVHGELYAEFLGLGNILPREKVQSALQAIGKINSQATRYGLVVLATPDGKMFRPGDNRVEILADEAIPACIGLVANGDPHQGLEYLRRLYDCFTVVNRGSLWDTPDFIMHNGGYHPRTFHHYLRVQNLWALMKVLNGWNYSAADQSLAIGPVLEPEDCFGPWICSKAYGTLRQRVEFSCPQVTLEVREGEISLKRLEIAAPARMPNVETIRVRAGGKEVPSTFKRNARLLVEFASPITLAAGEKLEVDVR